MRTCHDLGNEAEILGRRLDAARSALARSKTDWSRNHWRQVIDTLTVQWNRLPAQFGGEAVCNTEPRWKIDYGFWEGEQEGNLYNSGVDRLLYRLIRGDRDLAASWDRHIQERLAKAAQ